MARDFRLDTLTSPALVGRKFVGNGRITVDETVAARDQGRQLGMILMAVRMAVGGYEATELLRRGEYRARSSPQPPIA